MLLSFSGQFPCWHTHTKKHYSQQMTILTWRSTSRFQTFLNNIFFKWTLFAVQNSVSFFAIIHGNHLLTLKWHVINFSQKNFFELKTVWVSKNYYLVSKITRTHLFISFWSGVFRYDLKLSLFYIHPKSESSIHENVGPRI